MIVRCQQEDTGLNLDLKPGLVKDIMWRANVFYEKGRGFGEPHVGVQWSDQLPGLAEQFCSCMASGKVTSPLCLPAPHCYSGLLWRLNLMIHVKYLVRLRLLLTRWYTEVLQVRSSSGCNLFGTLWENHGKGIFFKGQLVKNLIVTLGFYLLAKLFIFFLLFNCLPPW